MKNTLIKTPLTLLALLLALSPVNILSQGVRVVNEDTDKTSKKENPEKEKTLRNPFATASGTTSQRIRLTRQALKNTRVLGIAHTNLGKITVIQTDNNETPLILDTETTFSVRATNNQWIDVVIDEISEFEVKVRPVGSDGKIILR